MPRYCPLRPLCFLRFQLHLIKAIRLPVVQHLTLQYPAGREGESLSRTRAKPFRGTWLFGIFRFMDVKLPKLGEGAESGVVVSLAVKEGDTITKGQTILELENEKAVAAIPSSAAGVVRKINVKTGDRITAGQVILVLDGANGAPAAPAAEAKAAPKAARPARPAQPEPQEPEEDIDEEASTE